MMLCSIAVHPAKELCLGMQMDQSFDISLTTKDPAIHRFVYHTPAAIHLPSQAVIVFSNLSNYVLLVSE